MLGTLFQTHYCLCIINLVIMQVQVHMNEKSIKCVLTHILKETNVDIECNMHDTYAWHLSYFFMIPGN